MRWWGHSGSIYNLFELFALANFFGAKACAQAAALVSEPPGGIFLPKRLQKKFNMVLSQGFKDDFVAKKLSQKH